MRLTLLILLASLSPALMAQELSQKDKAAIMKVFLAQQQAWNAGDIDTFMNGYLESDSLSFIGGNGVTWGYDQTKSGYHRRYPDRTAMGQLKFEVVQLRKLAPKTAFLIGKWHLTRDIGDIGGHFSLVWKKEKGEWVIISDHTSVASE